MKELPVSKNQKQELQAHGIEKLLKTTNQVLVVLQERHQVSKDEAVQMLTQFLEVIMPHLKVGDLITVAIPRDDGDFDLVNYDFFPNQK